MRIAGYAWLAVCGAAAPAAASQLQVLHRFQYDVDGYGPQSVIKGPDGDLYAVLLAGPDQSGGPAVVQLRPPPEGQTQWTSRVVHQFPGPAKDGTRNWLAPPLLADAAGNLYGTIEQAKQFEYAPENGGYVFELTHPTTGHPDWTLRTLLSRPDFATLRSVPRLSYVDSGGALFGYTDCYYGTGVQTDAIVRLAPPTAAVTHWTSSVLTEFANKTFLAGVCPAGIARAADGSFYGADHYGGQVNTGEIYSLTPPADAGGSWTYRFLTDFISGADDGDFDFPFNTPAVDRSLTLFVSTFVGGDEVTETGGTVLRATPPAPGHSVWNYQLIYSLPGGDTMDQPVVEDRDGRLYGITSSASAGRCGVVFRITAAGDPAQPWHGADLHVFTGSPDGAITVGPLIRSTIDGGSVFFGVTQRGGNMHVAPLAPNDCNTGDGTVFALTP